MVSEKAKGIPPSEGCVDVTRHTKDPINLIRRWAKGKSMGWVTQC